MQSLAWPYAAAGLAVPAVVYFLTPQSTPAIGRSPGEPEPAVVTSARRRNQRTAATTLGAVGAAAAAAVAFGLVKNKNFQSAATGTAIGSAALALLLLATLPAEAAPPILPPTPPGPRPAEPGRSLAAYVAADATLYAQPDVRATAVRSLPRGARIEVETAAPGWVYAYYVPTGLAPAEGYLRIEDISALPVFGGPSDQPTRQMYVVRDLAVLDRPNGTTVLERLSAGSAVMTRSVTSDNWVEVLVPPTGGRDARVGFAYATDLSLSPVRVTKNAIVLRETRIHGRPGDISVATLKPGARVEVFAVDDGGWAEVRYITGGDIMNHGYVRSEDLVVLSPDPERRPDPIPDLPAPAVTSITPASSVFNRPSKVVVSQPPAPAASAAAYLTGEQGEDDALLQDTLKELRERHAAMDAYYRATWRPKYGANLPPTLTSGSEYRSFDTQAGIVAIQLRTAGITKASDEAAIRAALRQSLTTRSVPGFSRHHWGTEVDILTANARAWAPGGRLAALTAFVHDEAPRFGLYTPYKGGAFPEPTRPHYNTEPWHLSLWRRAAPLQTRWLEVVQGPVLETLYDCIAARLGALSDADTARVRRVLPTLDLPSYVRNTAPVPTRVEV